MNNSELLEFLTKVFNKSTERYNEKYDTDFEIYEGYNAFEDDDDKSWSDFVYEMDDEAEVDGYTFKSLERVGGEGEGDHMHWVFSITDPEGNVEYWKKDGYWVSYNGAYWDDYDPYKVTPKTKQVTYYE